MASRSPFALSRASTTCLRLPSRWASNRFALRFYSTPSADAAGSSLPTPPLLQKLKGELKTAMRAKDAPRLTVLRTIFSENLNASKTSSPIKTDLQLVALIRKLKKGTEEAAAEAKAVNREDLVEKELGLSKVYGEYLAESGVQTVAGAELKVLVQDIVEECKKAGTAPKSLVKDVMARVGQVTEGKDVDRKEVANLIKDLTS